MYKTKLPYDYARCEGLNCALKDTCLRHIALADIGPRTTIQDRVCGIFAGLIVDGYRKVEYARP